MKRVLQLIAILIASLAMIQTIAGAVEQNTTTAKSDRGPKGRGGEPGI